MSFKHQLLGKYVKVIGGFAFKSENFTEVGILIVRISDIQGGTVSVDKVALIPEASIGKGKNYANELGDILIAMSGATTGKIGLVPQNINGLILQNQRVVTQSTISGINQSNLAQIPVIQPPLNLQQDFGVRVTAIEPLKLIHRASLSEHNNLFASLQHRAFRGEL